jgi:biotin carboxyl carrier protein
MKILGPNGSLEVTPPASFRLHPEGHNEFSIVDGQGYSSGIVAIARDGDSVWVWDSGNCGRFTLPEGYSENTDHEARAPMTGKVANIAVEIGQAVKLGDTLATLEAMKMEYKLEAEADGIVDHIGAKEGDLVDLGQLIVRLK